MKCNISKQGYADMPANMKKPGGRARKAILQKILDLLQSICYNTITSERFFFFAKEPVVMPCALARVLFVRVSARAGATGRAKPREAFTFTLPNKSA